MDMSLSATDHDPDREIGRIITQHGGRCRRSLWTKEVSLAPYCTSHHSHYPSPTLGIAFFSAAKNEEEGE